MLSEVERWRDSANIYAELAPKISFYRETSKRIVKMASLEGGMSVVYLGCGSACLSVIEMLRTSPALRIIYCVDISEEMLEVARRRVCSNVVKFICCPAEDLDNLLSKKIDCVICNSVLWLFDLPRSLRAIRRILLPTGYLVFNFAEWDFEFHKMEMPYDHKYDAIDQQLTLHGLPKKQSRGSSNKLSMKKLQDILNHNGFCIIKLDCFDVSVTATDWLYFYQIPAIAKRSLPNIPLDVAMEILHDAMESLKNCDLPPIRWIAVKAKCA